MSRISLTCTSERNIVAKMTSTTSQIAIERSNRSASITLSLHQDGCLPEESR